MSLSDTLFEVEKMLAEELYRQREFCSKEVLAKADHILELIDELWFTPGMDTPPVRPQPPRRTAAEIIDSFTANINALPSLSQAVGQPAESYDPEVMAKVMKIADREREAEAATEEVPAKPPQPETEKDSRGLPVNPTNPSVYIDRGGSRTTAEHVDKSDCDGQPTGNNIPNKP